MSSNKKYVVEANFIEEASKLDLSLQEFLLLIYFDNSDDQTFDITKICNKLKISEEKVVEAYNNLLLKNIIELVSVKDSNNKLVEKVTMNGFYNKLKDTKEKEEKTQAKNDIFTIFEEKFKRPLNGTEFEIIKAWVEKMYTEEIILAALDEAVYNGATNIRYIDTILYEWSKKGIKTKEDVLNIQKNRYENKKIEETNVFEYNWLDDENK